MIAIFAAMESEVAACPEWARRGEKETLEGAVVFQGEGALVCQTGIGRERARQAAETTLSRFTASAVLSVGLAGGLAPGIEVGDVVLCTHVDHESHRHSAIEQSIYASEQLFGVALDLAREAGLAVRTGTSLTVDEAAWGPSEKAEHHAWKAHDIVEMESFWVAEAASRRGLSFLAVRAVSDSSADTLPNLGVMRPDGTLDSAKFIAHLQAHPETGDQLSRIAQGSKLALGNLATFLERMLPALLELSSRTKR